MKIQIKKLSLLNFKGIKSYEIVFFNNSTNIYGDNATGKTTLMDAFLWLLFGKDSSDRKDFEIKTLDATGKVIQKIDHEVIAVIDADGTEYTVKRILREKWVTKRGSKDPEFTGNETLYFWNDVPLQQKEFQAKINSLVNEDVFKLLTNVLYFNSLPWEKRRTVLMSVAGGITDGEIASGNPAYQRLIDQLTKESKTLSEYKREIAARKKKLKDEITAIPTRIDEATRNTPEQIDFSEIERMIAEKNMELGKVEDDMLDASKSQQENFKLIQQKQNEVHQLKTQKQNAEFEIKQLFNNQKNERQVAITELNSKISLAKSEHTSVDNAILNITRQETTLITERDDQRKKWNVVNAEELKFDESQFCCPTCKRAFEDINIEEKKAEMLENFNADKQSKLNKIKERGDEINIELQKLANEKQPLLVQQEEAQQKVVDLQNELQELQQKIATQNHDSDKELQTALSTDSNITFLNSQISTLEQEILSQQSAPADNSELRNRKASITSEIDNLKKQLATKDQIEKSRQRIEELHAEERNLAQQIADIECIEFTIEKFNKEKMDALETKINGKFTSVRFKLFDTQINGGEVECCETLINGVPFSDANNAAKINAGLDIINTLSSYYNVKAPIFIDNRESVTSLIDTESQLVNLIVSPADKKLRVA